MTLSRGRSACAGLRRSTLSLALLLALLFPSVPACGGPGASSSHPGGPPATPGSGRGHGKLLPVLPDGTPVEPSTDRAEFTESAEILEDGRWDWNVDVASGAVDRLDVLHTNDLEWMHVEVRHGIGNGLEWSARAESWNRVAVQQGAVRQELEESGLGPTTLTLRQRLTGGADSVLSACVGVHVKLPGAATGPGTRAAEGGVFVPASIPLGDDTHLRATAEGDMVSDALGTGYHLEGVTSLELSRDIGERLSVRCEAVSIWYGETGRPWMGVLDAGLSADPAPHLEITLGAATGIRGSTADLGGFGRVSVHR